MDRPLVSIVTPTYNQAEYIEETVESVLSQSYSNIEYVVIDDGSTDDTPNVLEKYMGKDGVQIIRYEQNCLGQTKTINMGWEQSNGQILAYLNSDDTYYNEDVVSEAVEALESNLQAHIVYGGSVYTDSTGRTIGTYEAGAVDFDAMVLQGANPIPQPSTFIRREVFENVGPLDETIFSPMDWDFWLRSCIKFEFLYVPEVWSTFRLHPSSKSSRGGSRAAADFLRIYDKLLEDPDFPDYLKEQRNKLYSRAHLMAANQNDLALDSKSYRSSLWKAWKAYPGNLNMRDYLKWGGSLFGCFWELWLSKHRLRRFAKLK